MQVGLQILLMVLCQSLDDLQRGDPVCPVCEMKELLNCTVVLSSNNENVKDTQFGQKRQNTCPNHPSKHQLITYWEQFLLILKS